MKYLKGVVLITLLVGCGNDSYYQNKDKFRLLNVQESNITEKSLPNKLVEAELIVSQESNLSTVNQSITSSALQERADQNRSKEQNNTVLPSFEEAISEKNFTLESDLKRMEMEQKRTALDNEKEIALAKLANEKLIAQEKITHEQKKVEIEAQNQKELELARLESQKVILANEKALAQEKSLHEKEIALAKLETDKIISENEQKLAENKTMSEKEVALAKLEIEKEQNDKDLEFYKMITLVVSGLVILILLIIYLIHRRNKKIELRLHEEELMHQKYLEASKQHNENLKKMLEIVTDEKTDKNIKKEIVRLLKDQGKQSNLIEHKK